MAVLSLEDAELPPSQFLSSQVAGRSGFQGFLHSLGVQAPQVPLQVETQPLQWAGSLTGTRLDSSPCTWAFKEQN